MSAVAVRQPLRLRVRSEVSSIIATLSWPVTILFLASWTVAFFLFGHNDLRFTAQSSYAYLYGHWSDFYSYNKANLGGDEYFPSIYLVFAVWMSPIKLLISHTNEFASFTSWELLWAKLGLSIVFIATVWLMVLIARELFPGRTAAQRSVVATYLLSPFIGFVVGGFGQYDILGVFFTLLGFLYYLRGDKWRFALFFGVAASFKYFALLVFAPLLVLAYKKLRHLFLLSTVALSLVAIEALAYLHDPVFRDLTLGFRVAQNVGGAADNPTLKALVGVIFVAGLFLLWRARPTNERRAQIAVHAAALAYGLMFVVVFWNLVWFVILAPFFAMAVGYLRRPGRWIIWESIAFLAYIWLAPIQWARNVDVNNLIDFTGPLRSLFGPPHLLLGDIYPAAALPALHVVLIAYFISPVLFLLAEQVETSRNPSLTSRPVSTWQWALRAGTVALFFTLPALFAMWVPMKLATAIQPGARTYAMRSATLCSGAPLAPHPIADDRAATQTFVAGQDDLDGVAIAVGTYQKTAHGTMTIEVTDSSGALVSTATTNLSRVSDNAAVYDLFDAPQAHSKGETYTVAFRTNGVTSDLALWGTATDCDATATFTSGGVVQPADLQVVAYYPAP